LACSMVVKKWGENCCIHIFLCIAQLEFDNRSRLCHLFPCGLVSPCVPHYTKLAVWW
jgi:hypothetical protein